MSVCMGFLVIKMRNERWLLDVMSWDKTSDRYGSLVTSMYLEGRLGPPFNENNHKKKHFLQQHWMCREAKT